MSRQEPVYDGQGRLVGYKEVPVSLSERSCTYPHCAGMRQMESLVRRFKEVADVAGVLLHTIQDRKGLSDFERDVEFLRKALCKAGYERGSS